MNIQLENKVPVIQPEVLLLETKSRRSGVVSIRSITRLEAAQTALETARVMDGLAPEEF